jgi:hypothetical protein
MDGEEVGLMNWVLEVEIFAYDGSHDVITLLTGSGGYAYLTGLLPGTYIVSERLDLAPPGWTPTTPPSVEFDLTSGQAMSVSFGNVVTGVILGNKFYDKNMDGYWDLDEPGLAGWVIHLDGVDDMGGEVHRMTTTDSEGCYEFEGVQPGLYEVTEELQADWMSTTPMPQVVDVSGTMTYFMIWVDIGNVHYAWVHGHKFLDTYSDYPPFWPNGLKDPDEIYLGNWVITLQGWTVTGEYVSMVAYTENVEPNVGYYEFTGLLPGAYWVNETMQYGFYATTPVCNLIYVYPFPMGQVEFVINFGNLLPSPDPELNFVLKAGWNLWSSPLYVKDGMFASDLAALVGPNCRQIMMLDPNTAKYRAFIPGFNLPGEPEDFAILQGVGYFIVARADTAFTMIGDLTPDKSVALMTGWNAVGYNSLSPISASDLASMVVGSKVKMVMYLDAESQTYKGFIPGFHTPGGEEDFVVTQGRGYFIVTGGAATLSFGDVL